MRTPIVLDDWRRFVTLVAERLQVAREWKAGSLTKSNACDDLNVSGTFCIVLPVLFPPSAGKFARRTNLSVTVDVEIHSIARANVKRRTIGRVVIEATVR